MNDVKLQEGHPVDENLRPLKIGGESSSLELSQHENGSGARVTGDLEVTGDTYASIDKMYSGLVPAYAGMILGYTALGIDAADSSYSVTNAFVVVDSTANLTFTAPPSGNVEIEVFVFADCAVANRNLRFGLSDNSTYNAIDVTHEHEVATVDETDEISISHKWTITGLTSGTSYTYYLGARASHSSVWVLRWGGDVTNEYAPLIMKATALPSTIYTG